MAMLKRTERSRNLILDAADAAFREQGFAETSVEDIATRAGLTRKTLYNLFASKEDIALKLIHKAEAQDLGYRARMERGERAVELLGRVLRDSADWCLANPALAGLALSPASRPSSTPPEDRPSFQGLVRDIMILGQSQGSIRRDEDPGFLALVLLGVFGQAMLNALASGSMQTSDIAKIVRIVVEGIGSRLA